MVRLFSERASGARKSAAQASMGALAAATAILGVAGIGCRANP